MIRSRVVGMGGWACLSLLMACNGSISGDAGAGGAAGAEPEGGEDAVGAGGADMGRPSAAVQVHPQVQSGEGCGDGVLQAGEQCDGDNLGGRDCHGLGFDSGTLRCAPDCTFDVSDCALATCGDDVVNHPLEECDRDDLNGESCESLGFDGGDLTCGAGCTFDTTSCLREDCYDRRDNDADELVDCDDPTCAQACADACFAPPLLGDPGSAVGSTVGHASGYASGCGALQSGSEVVYRVVAAKTGMLDVLIASHADLGIAAFSECGSEPRGCSDTLPGGGREQLSVPVQEGETLFLMVDGHGAADAGAFTLDIASRSTICGDGAVEGYERCDDGNDDDGDGCSSNCEFECDVLDCDDGDACTADQCSPDSGCVHPSIDSDDGDACTIDQCDPDEGVSHVPLPNIDDLDICSFDFCDPATGSISHSPAEYLKESFSSNPDGWTLDKTWEVGPATVSSNQIGGYADPSADQTSTWDNGIAGVVIGGNVGTTTHEPYYLVSPPVDVSEVPGPVTLEFWRWLNSDYPPYANATVEVFDGASWVQVFGMVPGVAVNDHAWKLVRVDLTAFKSSKLQVRWGYSIDAASSYNESGWNVDDVRIVRGAPGECD